MNLNPRNSQCASKKMHLVLFAVGLFRSSECDVYLKMFGLFLLSSY